MPKTRILVIDDDETLRDLLVELLSANGHPAMGLTSPQDAEEAVSFWGASVVLCDICMPGIDGMQICARLKEINPGTRVLLMTGYPGPESVEEATEVGADGYLIKPFESIEHVLDAIENTVRHVWDWKQTMREAIRHEFPEEYKIIYASDAEVPCEEVLAHLLAEAGDTPAM